LIGCREPLFRGKPISLRIPRPTTGRKEDSLLDNHPKHGVHLLGEWNITNYLHIFGAWDM
jgi:hypothetical protein